MGVRGRGGPCNPVARLRSGFTLGEVAVALFLLSLLALGAALAMSQAQSFRRNNEHRTIAVILAKNEIEAMRVAGPAATSSTERVNSAGVPDPEGRYRLVSEVEIVCGGGRVLRDDPNTDLLTACGGRNATIEATVLVIFPDHGGVAFADTLGYRLELTERGRYGEAEPIY